MSLPTSLQLEVVTPEKLLISLPVDEMSYRTAKGYVGILPGHVPMLTTLEIGVLSYRSGKESHAVAVSTGFVEVLPDRVIVMADTAEKDDEIDRVRAQAARQDAESKLRQGGSEDEFLIHRARVERAMARLSASAHHQH
jgi:F-type H+-transporting ATPase subunit epsilon